MERNSKRYFLLIHSYISETHKFFSFKNVLKAQQQYWWRQRRDDDNWIFASNEKSLPSHHHRKLHSFFKKMGHPRPLFRFFVFSNKHYNSYNKQMRKNVHPVYGAGIRTYDDLWNMSLLPWPLDQGSRPTGSTLCAACVIFCFCWKCFGLESLLCLT